MYNGFKSQSAYSANNSFLARSYYYSFMNDTKSYLRNNRACSGLSKIGEKTFLKRIGINKVPLINVSNK